MSETENQTLKPVPRDTYVIGVSVYEVDGRHPIREGIFIGYDRKTSSALLLGIGGTFTCSPTTILPVPLEQLTDQESRRLSRWQQMLQEEPPKAEFVDLYNGVSITVY